MGSQGQVAISELAYAMSAPGSAGSPPGGPYDLGAGGGRRSECTRTLLHKGAEDL